MNLFITDIDPEIAAYNLCRVHVNKMILETAQLLSTAHRIIDGDQYADSVLMYKATHKNHPCSVWVRNSTENYQWAYNHFKALCEVYTLASSKTHKTADKLLKALQAPPDRLQAGKLTPFVIAADDDIKKTITDPVQAYHVYMNRKYREWLARVKPIKVEFPVSVPVWADSELLKLIK